MSRTQLESMALAECSLLRTQLPATFRVRSSIALTAEFLSWKDRVDVSLVLLLMVVGGVDSRISPSSKSTKKMVKLC